jgi:hypothetical protein
MRVCVPVQAELPFKSKPKVQAARSRQTLEQKRAVVLEPAERKAVSLVQQLNALRNEKTVKRRAKQARQHEVRAAGGCCLFWLFADLSRSSPGVCNRGHTDLGGRQ